MKVLNVFTADVASRGWLRRGFVHDEVLAPQNSGKQLARGQVWVGHIDPLLDLAVDAVEPLARGSFALGHFVHAEVTPPVLDLALRYVGDLVASLHREVRDYAASPGGAEGVPDVDVAALLAATSALHAQLAAVGVASENSPMVGDAARRFQDAARDIKARRSTGDALQGFLPRSRDATRAGLGAIRAAATRRWSQPAAPTRDSVTEVRDYVHAANRATNMRDRISAINAANRAHWSARTRDHLEALLPRPGTRAGLERQIRGAPASGGKTPAEINAENRKFWAERR